MRVVLMRWFKARGSVGGGGVRLGDSSFLGKDQKGVMYGCCATYGPVD
jgi:hypothetical protein